MSKTPSMLPRETTRQRLALASLMALAGLGATAPPARADSLVSSASSAGSQSVGSLSDSLRASSASSQRDDDDRRRRAAGDYRVVAVEELPPAGGNAERRLRVGLRPVPAAAPAATGADTARADLWLELPQRALGEQGLARGDAVAVRERPYGLEFARGSATVGAANQAFYLLLADDWMRELPAHALAARHE